MITTLLAHPDLIASIVGLLLMAIAWGARKLFRLWDLEWSAKFLSLAGSHARDAVDAALATYREEIAEGRADGELTDDEIKDAVSAAKRTFLDRVSLATLRKALTASTGQKPSIDDTQKFAESMVEGVIPPT